MVELGHGAVGSSSTTTTTSASSLAEGRRFPLAAQPEVMRAAEKDDQYASYVSEACRDAFRHLFGSGQQTLGEEYCDITQVAGPYGLPPTRLHRQDVLSSLYQTAVPYIAQRIRLI